MKNKIIFSIVCLIVVCIVISIFVTLFAGKGMNKNEAKNENVLATIESTREAKIEENGIEVKKIKVVQEGQQVKIESTVKNNTKKDIKELFITLELYDENDKAVSSFSKRVVDTINVNSNYSFDVYAMLNDEYVKIKSAKITNIYTS